MRRRLTDRDRLVFAAGLGTGVAAIEDVPKGIAAAAGFIVGSTVAEGAARTVLDRSGVSRVRIRVSPPDGEDQDGEE